MFFSTFFGGSDVSWASPVAQVRLLSLLLSSNTPLAASADLSPPFALPIQSSYFRNFQIQAGSAVSDGSGATVRSAASTRARASSFAAVALGLVAMFAMTR